MFSQYLFQFFYPLLQPVYLFALVSAIVQTGSGHALADASLGDKLLFQSFLVAHHHFVHHVA